LATYMGWVQAMTGDLDQAEEFANVASGAGDSDTSLEGNTPALLLLRTWIAMGRRDYETATQAAQQALRALDAGQSQWKIIALWAIAESQERTGHMAEAIDAFREAASFGRMLNNQVFAVVVEMSLAAALNNHGERHEAVAVCEETIQRHLDEHGRMLPVAGVILSRLAMLHYEANELDLAYQYMQQGLTLSEEPAMGSLIMFSYGISVPILHARGEIQAAQDALQRAHKSISQQALTEETWLLATAANMALKLGDTAAALRWMSTAGISSDDDPDYMRLDAQITHGRLLLAQGLREEAGKWLARLEQFTQGRGLLRPLASINVLQALLAERSGDISGAHEKVAQAIQIAAPQNYYRAILDEDARVIGLLPRVRPIAPAFVSQLLEFAGLSQPAERPSTQALVEPLSEREIEVLHLIAAGLANRDIADQLVIAVGTVKRHINNIYGKLDVRNRTQAVAKARELGIL
jgi:LuxR family transcriptional regulator, maltose regulon positive regulatory protein